jgi:two-component system LytT family response regulator
MAWLSTPDSDMLAQQSWPVTATRAWLVGFAYWLIFLLMLEPGNIFGSHGGLDPRQEVLRIAAAALLGSSISPLVLMSVSRFPMEGERVWRNAVLQFLGALLVSAGLIFLSCVLAEWLLASERRPFLVALRQEFKFNWMLVTFCTITFIGFFHTRFAHHLFGLEKPRPYPVVPYLSTIAVKSRSEIMRVSVGDVCWIEAQGNYLALHSGGVTHLLRDSIANLQAKLNPDEFIRVHRGAIVAVRAVAGMSPAGSGDAELRMTNGCVVRLSRKYRAVFLKAWNSRERGGPKP